LHLEGYISILGNEPEYPLRSKVHVEGALKPSLRELRSRVMICYHYPKEYRSEVLTATDLFKQSLSRS
jgi:hypothetical protein